MIKWSQAADDDLAAILRYFAHKGEILVGDKIVKKIIEAAKQLKTSPLSGRPGYFVGTRELVILKVPYVLVYGVLDKRNTEILHVMHTSQEWPPSEEDGANYEIH